VRAKEFSGLICSLLDARKNEVYVALFRRDGEALSRLTEDAVGPIDFVIDLLRIHGITEKRPALLVGDGAVVYECQWTRSFGPSVKISLGREYGSLAAQAARLSEHRFRSRSVDDVGAVEPIYLRWSEAERKLRLSTLTS
jgi:tRNA A37 threonylcarbamoyladenosine modification protein TsaB